VTMTPGDCGSRETNPEETARIRRGEAGKAAILLGASYECAEFRDMAIFNDDSSRRRVCELIRRQTPAIVLTAAPIDYHTDHEATSVLVRDACFAASAPNYETGGDAAALDAIPHLYFMDSTSGVDRSGNDLLADLYVDVEADMETKKAALAAHASQRDWLRRQHGIDDYLIQMETWTRIVGRRAGLRYAEGFRRYLGHPYPQTPLLEEALGLLAV
ncbi:MAG: PIG-L family deacetylase, partial [Bryobacteraceae bacterium]